MRVSVCVLGERIVVLSVHVFTPASYGGGEGVRRAVLWCMQVTLKLILLRTYALFLCLSLPFDRFCIFCARVPI